MQVSTTLVKVILFIYRLNHYTATQFKLIYAKQRTEHIKPLYE